MVISITETESERGQRKQQYVESASKGRGLQECSSGNYTKQIAPRGT